MSSSGSVEEPLESSAGGDDLSSANKPAEPSGATLDQVQSDESSKTSSPSYEQDKKADDENNDDTDVESSFSKPAAITRRKLSDYVPPEEQVILEKVTAVDPEKPYKTPEPLEQEQREKAIAIITGDIPADAAESDLADVEAVVDDMEALAEESLTSRRGRSAVSSLQSYRGRGRGGRVTRGQARTESESNGLEGAYESEKSEGEGTSRGRGRVSRNIRRGRGSRRLASLSQSGMVDRKSRDVVDFQESDEESVKTVERSKESGSNVDTVSEEVVKGNYEESLTAAGSSPPSLSGKLWPKCEEAKL